MRPQLLDRFGLSVNVGTLVDTDERLKMVLDRMRYDNEPAALLADSQPEMDELQVPSLQLLLRLSIKSHAYMHSCCFLLVCLICCR